jgi:molybdopterin synthase catalytic subunit
MIINIRITSEPIDINKEFEFLSVLQNAGAVVTFTGQVRGGNGSIALLAMELEHYPGMTEASIQGIADEAVSRWPLLGINVVHRVGHLLPSEPIVFVGAASEHRAAAFAAAEFIMDYLKTRAPFWKKEITAAGEQWVDAREADTQAAHRW